MPGYAHSGHPSPLMSVPSGGGGSGSDGDDRDHLFCARHCPSATYSHKLIFYIYLAQCWVYTGHSVKPTDFPTVGERHSPEGRVAI